MRKLVRSVMFSPADRLSAMSKAIYSLDADVVVFDLEDAVGPTFKEKARENVIEILKTGAFDRCSVVVRVNCPVTTPWGRDDIDAISFSQSLRAILLPKVEDESTVNVALGVLQKRSIKRDGRDNIWCMIETAKGVQNVASIANLLPVTALVFGSNDLTKDLRAKHTPSREPLLYSMSRCIVAARASGKIVIDGVHMDLKDETGLRNSCIQGRNLGFDGKSLIHPSQIEITNHHFSPYESEIVHAQNTVDSYNDAILAGNSLCVVDDKLVEELHVKQALDLLKDAAEIAQLKSNKAAKLPE